MKDILFKETQERLEYLMGLKLNNFKSPKSELEKNFIISLGKEWFEKNKDKSINIY